jgi:hypothetical protein
VPIDELSQLSERKPWFPDGEDMPWTGGLAYRESRIGLEPQCEGETGSDLMDVCRKQRKQGGPLELDGDVIDPEPLVQQLPYCVERRAAVKSLAHDDVRRQSGMAEVIVQTCRS